MTFPELEKWAEENGFVVGARDFPTMGTALAEFRFRAKASGDESLRFWRRTLPAAKRALCRAVEKLLNSKRAGGI